MNRVRFTDLGSIKYREAWTLQEELFNRVLSEKQQGIACRDDITSQTLIFCEHPHVYTLGKNGKPNNLLANSKLLDTIGAEYYKIDRGGDITYHGPGQLVGYPIFDLESMKIGVKEYINCLEAAIIYLLKDYSIESGRMEGATGVWLDPVDKKKARKICAIGVRISRYVTMHGFALNINTNLDYFKYINPCGFDDKDVTSLQRETGGEIHMASVKEQLRKRLSEQFSISWI
jgi:lipoyl(octanoyl) transferase